MTIRELINELQKASDKSNNIYVYDKHFNCLKKIDKIGYDQGLHGVENKGVIFTEDDSELKF